MKSIEEENYKEEIKVYVRAKINLEATLRSIFNVVWGQCSINLKSKLESKDEFKDIKENKGVAGLLKQIKAVVVQNSIVYNLLFDRSVIRRYQRIMFLDQW